jgi:hypothetical protein
METNYWEIRIEGHPSDLEYLTMLYTSADLHVLKSNSDSTVRVRSTRFDPSAGHEVIRSTAQNITNTLSGIVRLERSLDRPLEIGAIYLIRPDGSAANTVIQIKGAQVKITAGNVHLQTHSQGQVVPTPIAKEVLFERLAFVDDAVAKALRLRGATDSKSWAGLYRIYEVIRDDVGGESRLSKFDPDIPKEANRFTHSANSPQVGGDQSRHGVSNHQPPKKPMSLAEADTFVTNLLRLWVESKV